MATKMRIPKVVLKPMSMAFLDMYRADPMERICIIKLGIPVYTVAAVAELMAVSKTYLVATLGMSRADVDRQAREDRCLSTDDGARVLGVMRLVGQLQEMVAESGDPDDFDAPAWVARWLQRPLPAFGGRQPAEFMDTSDGQSLVSSMLARMQTGAYA